MVGKKGLDDAKWLTAIAVSIEHNLVMDGHHRNKLLLI